MNEDVRAIVEALHGIQETLHCDLDHALEVFDLYLDDRRLNMQREQNEAHVRLEEKAQELREMEDAEASCAYR